MPASVSFDQDLVSQVSSLPLADEPKELDDTLNTYTYPVLSVPPEIVSTIFENFLPTYRERPPPLGILSPLLLCQICQQWRRIAVSTPTLWRAIQMEFLDEDTERAEIMESRICLLETWLSRSGDCPLSLCLRYRSKSTLPGPSPIILSRVLHAIVRHCQRWEYIELLMPLEDLNVIQGHMPLLRHLTFGTSHLPQDDDRRALALFDRAPELKSVVLTESFVPAVIRLPWEQLTHVEGRCLWEDECAEILACMSQLRRCTLAICGVDIPSPISDLPVLSHLRHLELHVVASSNYNLMYFLHKLTLPTLRTLHVMERSLGPDPLNTLKRLIVRSQCTLDELGVDGATISESAYREALFSVQSIVLAPRPSSGPGHSSNV
ncbi:hypothetical protein B0H11DRAFT_1035343 [Mycena galericulata]|nr:hypothetical protein B0H11DRAFT_1035343 [Mycena galericulata]